MPKNPKWPPFTASTVAILDHVIPKTDRKAILNKMKLPETKIEAIWQILKLAKIQNGRRSAIFDRTDPFYWIRPAEFIGECLYQIWTKSVWQFPGFRPPTAFKSFLAGRPSWNPKWPPKMFLIQNHIKWSHTKFKEASTKTLWVIQDQSWSKNKFKKKKKKMAAMAAILKKFMAENMHYSLFFPKERNGTKI